MEYYKRKLQLLLEIKKRGQKEGIMRVGHQIFNGDTYLRKIIDKFESAGLIKLDKTNYKIHSKLTIKGKKLVKLLIKMDKVLNGI